MKLFTKIVSILLVAGLASATAQSATQSDKNFYVKGSVGYPDTDSALGDLNGLSGISVQEDESLFWGLEVGFNASNNFSYGFEYACYDADASIKATDLSTDQAMSLNDSFGLVGSTPNFGTGYDSIMSSEANLDSFMFIVNYEYFLNDQFSILLKGGLGLFDVKQSLKVVRDVDRAAGPIAPETLINKSDSDTALAYQLGVNMNYHITEAIALSVGARYIDSGDLEFNFDSVKVTEDDNGTLVYDFGVTYNF